MIKRVIPVHLRNKIDICKSVVYFQFHHYQQNYNQKFSKFRFFFGYLLGILLSSKLSKLAIKQLYVATVFEILIHVTVKCQNIQGGPFQINKLANTLTVKRLNRK